MHNPFVTVDFGSRFAPLPFDPPPPPQPKLLPSDVAGLRALLHDLIKNQPMNEATRNNMRAMHERLAGIHKDMPPSVACAVAEWLRALYGRDVDNIVPRGDAMLNAVVMSGDKPGAEVLLRAMQELTNGLAAHLSGAVAPAGMAPAAVAEEGVLEFIEPDASAFYALDASAGRELAALLDDLRNADRYIARGAPAPTRCLFDGPAGCGKTTGARWLAGQLGKPLAVIMLSGLVSKFIGETGARFAAAADAARAKDAVLLIDELDTVGGHREQATGAAGDHTAKAVGAINQSLDMLPLTMVVIGATNLPESVDPSVARRLQKRVHFQAPDQAARETMLRHHWRKAPYEDDAFAALVNRTDGRSGDLVERAAHDANRRAARRAHDAAVTMGDVLEALGSMPREAGLGETRTDSRLLVPGR